ncbi:MAG: DUF4157 domain-containing protein [Saprospiraceae bacterium]
MKVAEPKSSTSSALQHSNSAPLFQPEARGEAFFGGKSQPHSEAAPFGGEAGIQAKCAECEQEDKLQRKEEQEEQTPPEVQAKLKIGAPDDAYEKQADAVADQVVQRLANPTPVAVSGAAPLQRQAAPTEDEKIQEKPEELESAGEQVQMKPIFDSAATPPDDGDSVQRKPESGAWGMVQMKCAACEQEDPGKLQRKPDGSGETSATPDFSARLQSSKGGGSSLPADVSSSMGDAMGADFSNVRVHTGSEAAGMSDSIQAQAFTHGNDVYFNEGKYSPGSSDGQRLLAHELVHTVQQGGGVKRNPVNTAGLLIQRTGPAPASTSSTPTAPASPKMAIPANGSLSNPITSFATPPANHFAIDTINRKLWLPTLKLPNFKQRNAAKYNNGQNFIITTRETRSGQQADIWKNAVRQNVNAEITNRIAKPNGDPTKFVPRNINGDQVYFLKADASQFMIIGDEAKIREEALIPKWNRRQRPHNHDVDHIKELQMGGQDQAIDNLELLDASANRSSGSSIRAEFAGKVGRAFGLFLQTHSVTGLPATDTIVKNNYEIAIERINWNLEVSGDGDSYWSLEEIRDNKSHLLLIRDMTDAEFAQVSPNPNELMLFFGNGIGIPKRIPLTNNAYTGRLSLFRNFTLTSLTISNPTASDGSTYGSLTGEALRASGSLVQSDAIPVNFNKMAALPYTGQVELNNSSISRFFRFRGLSPIQFDEVYFDDEKGIIANGAILPDVPFINGANIEIFINGNDIGIRKVFDTGEFHLPPPLTALSSSLEVFASTERGLGVGGRLDFEVARLGQGYLEGEASTGAGFALTGGFNFDTRLFDPATIRVSYRKVGEIYVFSLGGTLGIPRGKVRGIKTATIEVNYSEGNFSAIGTAELDVPGVRQGTLTVAYSQEQFTIGGRFDLDRLPGISSGFIEAQVTRLEDGSYQVSARGSATPAIPGINSTLTVEYDNGAVLIQGTVTYQRDRLRGEVTVGVTNRRVNAVGQPIGPPVDTFTVWGTGRLTLRLTPWLQAIAVVRFLPNGEIEVTGRIELPSTVDILARRQFNRELFHMPNLEIPIFAIPLGPRSIGIVARITGGLDAEAGIGPVQIRDLFGEITYNPAHPENTNLRGGGRFIIPANAGLTLHADLGLGVSIAIASATGGIEIRGSLGLQGEASASIVLNWNPTTGLELNAEGSITVNPKFTFDINAFLRASLDLYVDEFSETWRHNLVSFRWGPNIRFGVRFPIHYREGEPFNISIDDLQIIYPDLNLGNMATNLGRHVKNEMI